MRWPRYLPILVVFIAPISNISASPGGACRDQPGSLLEGLQLPASPYAQGVDISHHNGAVPWRSLRRAGVVFAYLKATQGAHYNDPAFQRHWAMTKRCGIARGAYHFFDPRLDAKAQAEHFLRRIKNDPGELPPVVDVERGFDHQHIHCDQYMKALRAFIDHVQTVSGRAAMIYTGHRFWSKSLCDRTDFRDHPLWIAHYTASRPRLPGGWKRWQLWQYTPTAQTNSGTVALDLNQFRGDRASLLKWLRPPKRNRSGCETE